MTSKATWLVTGGAGFIGTNLVLALRAAGRRVVNLDALTYAGNRASLAALDGDPDHVFVHGDINDVALVAELLATHRPAAILHLAAESHVDRSIADATRFIDTNVVGTWRLLEAATRYWRTLSGDAAARFRFVHVSTDEVYGSLGPTDPPFSESTPYAPNSPYAASKAASDHFVRAACKTFGLPVVTTHCSNNYGPWQFPEKLVPLVILNALERRPLPVYGDGLQVRDWLHVADHCEALALVVERGRPGEVYDIGGGAALTNLAVVERLCDLVDELAPSPGPSRRALITFVADRPGHDRRYAIDSARITAELGWRPRHDFARGLAETVRWYLDHGDWVASVRSGEYRRWIDAHYGQGPGAPT